MASFSVVLTTKKKAGKEFEIKRRDHVFHILDGTSEV